MLSVEFAGFLSTDFLDDEAFGFGTARNTLFSTSGMMCLGPCSELVLLDLGEGPDETLSPDAFAFSDVRVRFRGVGADIESPYSNVFLRVNLGLGRTEPEPETEVAEVVQDHWVEVVLNIGEGPNLEEVGDSDTG